MSSGIYDQRLFIVDEGAAKDTPILLSPVIQWVGACCAGCEDDPSPRLEWDAEDAARTCAEAGWKHLENGPQGAGNYCPECQKEIAHAEEQRMTAQQLTEALTKGCGLYVVKDGALYAVITVVRSAGAGMDARSYEIRVYGYPDLPRLMDTAPTPERAVAALVAIAGATMGDVEVT